MAFHRSKIGSRHGRVAEIILYITRADAERIRIWLNREPCIAWILKEAQDGHDFIWKATETLAVIEPSEYCLWHKDSGPLNVPSGIPGVPDAIVADPYAGWSQRLADVGSQRPWFGGNLPGPYFFRFAEHGREAPGAIARSGFHWHADYFRPVGQPAPLEASKWWKRLGRFVRSQSTGIPWPSPDHGARSLAYAFPDAYAEILRGRPFDVNP